MEIAKFSNEANKIIEKSGLLPKEIENEILSISPEIQHNFKTQKLWRTEVEARASVLNDLEHPTPASKFHQAQKEQLVHFEQLIETSFQYEKLMIELEKKELEKEEIINNLETKFDELAIREKDLEIKQLNYRIFSIKLQAKERAREILQWSKIKEELIDNNENFDVNDRETNSIESYCLKLITKYVNTDMSSTEMKNIYANLISFLKLAGERGVLNNVLSRLPKEILKKLSDDKIIILNREKNEG